MSVGGVGDHPGDGGLAGSGRSVKDDGAEKPVCFNGSPEQGAFADDMLLPNDIVQCLWAHSGSQRCLGAHLFFQRVIK